MIHEEICTYEVCKLAQEKGFREMANCYQGYRKNGTLFYFSNIPNGKERVMQTDCLAPTQSLLQRWLREEKSIHIEICVSLSVNDKHCFYWTLCRKECDCWEDVGMCYGEYSTYELALEDALAYSLKNLV